MLAATLLVLLPDAPLGAQEAGSAAAEGLVEGRVVAEGSGAPLPGTTVELLGEDRSTVTNDRGYYALQGVAAGEASLRFRRMGYEALVERAEVSGIGSTVVDVALEARPVGLDPLVVLSRRTRMIGDPLNLAAIPGAAHFLSTQDLEARKLPFDNVHDVLRRIPGVNVQDEEGYGLRPNIGMRGTGVERSSKVTLMEDGVLIAPAPYAAPSAYYFPVAGRMEAIEVRKGSSQVRYGPRTIGGAVNLISSSIPEQTSWSLDTQGGGDRQIKVEARGGGSTRHFGWMVETYQLGTDGFKELQGGGDTGFRIGDYNAKLRINSDREEPRYQELELKVGYHDELSHETYLGLTDEDFAENPFLRYPASRRDLMDTEHRQVQLRHFVQPTAALDLTTTLYRNDFARNWYKLGSVRGVSIGSVLASPEEHAEELAILRGADGDDDDLSVRANNREYRSEGIQSVLGYRAEGAGASHDVELGVRLHRDEEDRFQWEDGYRMTGGVPVRTSEGVPGTQANRVGEARAWALYAQDEIGAGRFTLVPGVRYEHVELTRTDYPTDVPSRDEAERVRETSVSAFIPGLGAAFALGPATHVFGGVHRGFSPPGPGAAEGTRPESSVNYELGTRTRGSGLGLQVVGFLSDYRNILGQETLATGETGQGDQHNGGAVRSGGLETTVDYDLAWGRSLPVRIPASLSYTYTHATFRSSFESDFDPWGTVETGDHLPYLPRHQASAAIGVEDPRWSVTLAASGSSEMRTRAGKGPVPEAGATDGFLVLDLQAAWELPSRVGGGQVYGGIRNLTDRHYVVARRPAGARPGLPRMLYLGVKLGR